MRWTRRGSWCIFTALNRARVFEVFPRVDKKGVRGKVGVDSDQAPEGEGAGRVSGDSESEGAERAQAEFLKKLKPFEQVLVEVREKLYGGSWERMQGDLRARKDGRPHVFKLSETIERDLDSIERMQAFERRQGVDLARLLKLKD
jgi:hypothetical protein